MPKIWSEPNLPIGQTYDKSGKLIGTSYHPLLRTGRIDVGDKGHYGYPRFNLRNVGGGFYLNRYDIQRGIVSDGSYTGGTFSNDHYVGDMYAYPVVPTGAPSTLDGSSYGAEAYKRMKPTKPMFSGLNSLWELREVPEMLRQLFTKELLNAPNFWLALQFGWRPLYSDIVKLLKTQERIQDRIDWLLRHNGKPVRRRVLLKDDTQVLSVTDQSGSLSNNWIAPTLPTTFFPGGLKRRVTQSTGETIWASARFRYWLPEAPKHVLMGSSLRQRLYGFTLSPSVVYNAVPWSWLVDWFFSVGDMIENLDAGVADRCAADYFYVMRRNWTRGESTVYFNTRDSSNRVVPHTSTTTVTREVLSRVVGDPFGFSTKEEDLSPMQLSIIGALGLSRLR